jgi:hypothetical protein
MRAAWPRPGANLAEAGVHAGYQGGGQVQLAAVIGFIHTATLLPA